MTLSARIDLYARRAGEEFIAASRAPCPRARARHREIAYAYVGLLRERRAGIASEAAEA